jgi:chromosome segregation ATPase
MRNANLEYHVAGYKAAASDQPREVPKSITEEWAKQDWLDGHDAFTSGLDVAAKAVAAAQAAEHSMRDEHEKASTLQDIANTSIDEANRQIGIAQRLLQAKESERLEYQKRADDAEKELERVRANIKPSLLDKLTGKA